MKAVFRTAAASSFATLVLAAGLLAAAPALAIEPVLGDAPVVVEPMTLPALQQELSATIDHALDSSLVALTTHHLDAETETLVESHVGTRVVAPTLAAN